MTECEVAKKHVARHQAVPQKRREGRKQQHVDLWLVENIDSSIPLVDSSILLLLAREQVNMI